jgi:hypothetical protein
MKTEGILSGGKSGRDVKLLTTHFHLMSKLKVELRFHSAMFN